MFEDDHDEKHQHTESDFFQLMLLPLVESFFIVKTSELAGACPSLLGVFHDLSHSAAAAAAGSGAGTGSVPPSPKGGTGTGAGQGSLPPAPLALAPQVSGGSAGVGLPGDGHHGVDLTTFAERHRRLINAFCRKLLKGPKGAFRVRSLAPCSCAG